MSTKYIFISGGVISGVGKGTVTASTSLLLKSVGFKVAPVKCDMYLNIDAGTMNPLEHGEIFVTDDGTECDQDIGHYERFLNESLSLKNYITAGQIFWEILKKERALAYDGRCVEPFQQVPEEIIDKLEKVAKKNEIVLVELGGTVGEYQNLHFYEAARALNQKYPGSVCFIHIGYLLLPTALGELKSKPLQQSIFELFSRGIRPDIVICRSSKAIDSPRKKKIAAASGLPEENILDNSDVQSVYEVPIILERQGLTKKILKKLSLKSRKRHLVQWEKLMRKVKKLKKSIKIAMVAKYYTSGKYSLGDSYVSVVEAIKHAAWANNLNPEIIWLDSEKIQSQKGEVVAKVLKEIDGLIIPQGWGSRGVEGKIEAIKVARENKIPFLGLCFGMQMAVIEFSRHVCGLKNANSTEVNPKTPHPVIHIMPDQEEYLKKHQYGGTIRLGSWPCKIKKGTVLCDAYRGVASAQGLPLKVKERHRHRYEFNNQYKEKLTKAGLVISGASPDGKLVEAIELPKEKHPFFVGTQFHPEYKSRPLSPHPIFVQFIKVAKQRIKKASS